MLRRAAKLTGRNPGSVLASSRSARSFRAEAAPTHLSSSTDRSARAGRGSLERAGTRSAARTGMSGRGGNGKMLRASSLSPARRSRQGVTSTWNPAGAQTSHTSQTIARSGAVQPQKAGWSSTYSPIPEDEESATGTTGERPLSGAGASGPYRGAAESTGCSAGRIECVTRGWLRRRGSARGRRESSCQFRGRSALLKCRHRTSAYERRTGGSGEAVPY